MYVQEKLGTRKTMGSERKFLQDLERRLTLPGERPLFLRLPGPRHRRKKNLPTTTHFPRVMQAKGEQGPDKSAGGSPSRAGQQEQETQLRTARNKVQMKMDSGQSDKVPKYS